MTLRSNNEYDAALARIEQLRGWIRAELSRLVAAAKRVEEATKHYQTKVTDLVHSRQPTQEMRKALVSAQEDVDFEKDRLKVHEDIYNKLIRNLSKANMAAAELMMEPGEGDEVHNALFE